MTTEVTDTTPTGDAAAIAAKAASDAAAAEALAASGTIVTETTVTQTDPAAESEARSLGWLPEAEFKGDKTRWRDAKTFLEVGKQHNGILRENLDRVSREVQTLREQNEELTSTLNEFRQFKEGTEARGLARVKAELNARLTEAITGGDGAEATKILEERDALMKKELEAAKPKPRPGSGANDPAFVEFKETNPWYGTDAEMTRYADRVGRILRSEGERTVGKSFIDKIMVEVKGRYPDKFKPRTAPAPVDGGGDGGARGSGGGQSGRRYEDLPAEAKAACDKFVRQKLLTKEQYLNDYFN